MVERRLIAVLDGGVQAGLPLLQPAAREARHLALGHGQEFRQHRARLRQMAGRGVACRKPASNLVVGIVHLLQRGDRLLVAPRREQGDAAIPDDVVELEWIMALGDVELLECSLGLAYGNQVEAIHPAGFDIVRVES